MHRKDRFLPSLWLHLAVLVGLYYLLRWYRETQVVSHLRDKFVFITGCDSGFRNLLARQLDLRGLRVLAGCLTEQGAEQLRNQTSDRLQTVILDVTKTESIAAATEWVKERVGTEEGKCSTIISGLWGLVNNAGILLPAAPNEWLTKDDFSKILNVNLIGLIEVTLSLLPLIRRTRGRAVSVSSTAGRLSLFGGGYCISKYGVEAFSDSLRQDVLEGIWRRVSPGVKESYGQKYFEDCAFFSIPRVAWQRCYLLKPVRAQQEAPSRPPSLPLHGLSGSPSPSTCSADASSVPDCQDFHGLSAKGKENLSPVTNCTEHALTAVHPRIHYSIDWDSKCFTFALSYLPTPEADFILCHML
ncbi:retinol dehydrogenase 16-like [Cervus canadensis]|uniref:retinol dehydrogenase 16-like n=1 Tax=Cervus canadensis TaxID=1574408 RepID=UPI001CA37E1F|nr:retinol dehydrogenase 16-like [Cervus canadensis]